MVRLHRDVQLAQVEPLPLCGGMEREQELAVNVSAASPLHWSSWIIPSTFDIHITAAR